MITNTQRITYLRQRLFQEFNVMQSLVRSRAVSTSYLTNVRENKAFQSPPPSALSLPETTKRLFKRVKLKKIVGGVHIILS